MFLSQNRFPFSDDMLWKIIISAMVRASPSERTTMEKSAALLSAMANPKRLAILELLVQREVPVGELAARVGLSQSALSQHLSKLRAQKLVSTRRNAQTIYYSSHSPAVRAILATLGEIFPESSSQQLQAIASAA
jgi:DNA-binding transcriptional ArsR family regulator